MSSPDSTEEDDRGSFRRGGFLAAAGFLVLVVAFAVAVVVTNDDAGGTSPGKGMTSASAPAGSPPPAATGCHPTDTNQQVPQTAPAGIEWTVIKSVAVPTSRTAGPLIVDGDVARCFAHTPTGALVAAWQIEVRHIFCDGWKSVTEQQVMPGPGREVFEQHRAAITGDATDPGFYGQVAGYQFITYSAATAVIQFVARFTDGTMQVSVLTVVWSGGDWRLQLQPNGSETPSVQGVQSLDGFVPWGGV